MALGTIPNDVRVPLVYIEIDNSQALSGNIAQDQNVMLFGQMFDAGGDAGLRVGLLRFGPALLGGEGVAEGELRAGGLGLGAAAEERQQQQRGACAAQACGQAKLASNWIMGEISRRLNAEEIGMEAVKVTSSQLATLISRIQDGTISNNAARQVFEALWNGEATEVDAIIEAKGLKQMNDSGALEKIIDEVIAANPANVEQYRAGKDKAFNALVGQVMKASKGKANPQQVNELLKAKLA